jgi:hypothetical protein
VTAVPEPRSALRPRSDQRHDRRRLHNGTAQGNASHLNPHRTWGKTQMINRGTNDPHRLWSSQDDLEHAANKDLRVVAARPRPDERHRCRATPMRPLPSTTPLAREGVSRHPPSEGEMGALLPPTLHRLCLSTPNGGGEGGEAREAGSGVAAEEGSWSLAGATRKP